MRQFALAVLTVSAPCVAQTGSVTFYSNALTAKETVKLTLVPVGEQPFSGWLFDGPQRLAHARPGRFITFRLAPGTHSFTVPWKGSGPGKTPLVFNVAEGAHYCVRLSAKYVNGSVLLPVGWANSRIEQVPCQQAFQEAGTSKPLERKRVDAGALGELDPSPTFPHPD
jgi:hypothetical protein